MWTFWPSRARVISSHSIGRAIILFAPKFGRRAKWCTVPFMTRNSMQNRETDPKIVSFSLLIFDLPDFRTLQYDNFEENSRFRPAESLQMIYNFIYGQDYSTPINKSEQNTTATPPVTSASGSTQGQNNQTTTVKTTTTVNNKQSSYSTTMVCFSYNWNSKYFNKTSKYDSDYRL